MNPHFWPESFQVPHKNTKITKSSWRAPAASLIISREPSIARSEWQMITKSSDSQRIYLLTIKDREGKAIDTEIAPEILLDGDAQLSEIVNAGVGKWRVKLEFPKEQSITHLGFSLGEYRIDRFRRLHWQLHQVDRMMSTAFANKIRIRGDGKDTARVFVHLRDTQNFPIYQFHDFDLRLKVLNGKVKVEGPFSTVSGPYFKVYGEGLGSVKLEAFLDGESIGKQFEMELVGKDKRAPASVGQQCTHQLASFLGREVIPGATIEEEYQRLSDILLDSFQLLITPSDLELEANLQALSSPSCTLIVSLDGPRETMGRQLRQMAYKANRDAAQKPQPQGIWNRPKS